MAAAANGTTTQLDLGDWNTWGTANLCAFWTIIVLGQELLHYLVVAVGSCTLKRIPETGKHLDTFGWKDWFFVYFNRVSVPVMLYHLFQYTYNSDKIEWDLQKVSVVNVPVAMCVLYLVYDIMYVPFHWFLHVRGIYKWIHKHHHHQMAPSRGNLDASNTHPVEFVLGEYLHLASTYLVSQVIPIHVVGVFLFMAVGGLLASFNHTRLDLSIPGFYDVRAHDKHHHAPRTNYGQYTMFVDMFYGSYVANKVPTVGKSKDDPSRAAKKVQ